MTETLLESNLDLKDLNKQIKFWVAQNPHTKKYISLRRNKYLAVFTSYEKAVSLSLTSRILKNANIHMESFDNIKKIASDFFEGKYEIID